ncbi:MAG: serine/threonine protein kinase [Bryobacterales bacterium]|nr:serine/threonine protein kinase [Bryobacterales bacterium]
MNIPDTTTLPAVADMPAHRQLPREVVVDALRRLGWVSITLTFAITAVYLGGLYLQPGWIDPNRAPVSYTMSLAITAAAGLALFGFSKWGRRSLRPERILDVSLYFQVAIGLFLSLAENAVTWSTNEAIRGNSSVSVWILIFALAVPTTYWKALVAAVATALMGPIGLAVQVLTGTVSNPPGSMWLVLFSGNFLLAWAAPTLAKLVYHLASQVKAAREMGGYELVELLGRGGMGEVWRAQHRIINRQAAVKLIRPDLTGSRDGTRALMKRFRLEAEATARLHSPHTVALYDYGISDNGLFYYVMELLAGIDLQTLVSRYGPLPAPRAVNFLLQACDSLIEAHARGLIHRDIKPRNILVCRLGYNYDFLKVLDFGLVKLASGEQSMLTGQAIAGTPAFLAPEAISGSSHVDARTDLYGLGCVAYWLLTGRLVFERETAMATAVAHLRDEPVPPSQRTENEIPPELERIVLRCLAKPAENRPASAMELRQMLVNCRGIEDWSREMAESWWRIHLPVGADSDLMNRPANLKIGNR